MSNLLPPVPPWPPVQDSPSQELEALNYVVTIQHDLIKARQLSNRLHFAISGASEHADIEDTGYDAARDQAALVVIRTRIDGLQASLDAHIAGAGFVVLSAANARARNVVAEDLAQAAFELLSVIDEYLATYFPTER